MIYKGDLADRLLDRKLNPQFNGERTRFMISFPTHMNWWEKYGDLRAEMQMNDHPEDAIDRACNELYQRERVIADEGAIVSWEHAFTENEVSAIQHGMNRWLASPSAFAAEYQNDPMSETQDDSLALESRVVARRYSGCAKDVLPDWSQLVVASIDISEAVLWWTVTAFATTDKVSTHEMWADQMTVESADKLHSTRTDVTMTTWHSPPGADNHFFDCAVLAFVGASKLGATKTGHREAPRVQSRPRRKKSLKELYDQNNESSE